MADYSKYLYPPIVDDYMPAYTDGEEYKIQFSISPFQDMTLIFDGEQTNVNVRLSIRRQDNNVSIIKNEIIDEGKVVATLDYIDIPFTKNEDNFYEIIIDKTKLENDNFENNMFYRSQLMFVPKNVVEDYASEWSKVCLLKKVSKISPLEKVNKIKVIGDIVELYAKIVFDNKEEKERITKYIINVYEKGQSTLVYSKEGFFSSFNNTYYISEFLKHNFKKGDYDTIVNIITENLNLQSLLLNFKITGEEIQEGKGIIIPNNEFGYIDIAINEDVFNNVTNVYKRKLGEEWEYIHPLKHFKDYNVISGEIYEYAYTYKIDDNNTEFRKIPNNYVVNFNDMYLIGDKDILKVKFNPVVSSLKINRLDSKIDTIGSEYAFVKRNGNTKYKTFSIGGLISLLGESIYSDIELEDSMFDRYTKTIYAETIQTKFINEEHIDYNNITAAQERRFREAVMTFLYDGKPKLFKSLTEGNMIIKLIDINLSPEETLGRQIYSFSGTAIEIAECNNNNLFKYGIKSVEEV